MAKATKKDLVHQAEREIEKKSILAHDVAADCGQMFLNVKRMKWFREAVEAELAERYGKYEHLKPLP